MATIVNSLPLMESAQTQKYLTFNSAISYLDALVNPTVFNRTTATPPASPTEGDRYIIGSSPTGAWTGQVNKIAVYLGTNWVIFTPSEGWNVYDQGANEYVSYDGSAWETLASQIIASFPSTNLSVQELGVGGATADATNRLSINTPAVLLNNAGAGIDMTFNKNSVANDASLSFKTGFSVRGLIGLLGDDDFTFKVSPDGSQFHNGLVINRNSGKVTFNKKIQNGIRPWNVVQRNHVTSNAWLISTSAANNSWRSIAWSPELGLFAAVANSGTDNRVMTSPDGITWTSRTSGADNDWRGVAWSPELGLFAVVANSGIGNRVMTSPDGITWTTRTSAADNGWFSIAWSSELGLFAAVAITGTGNRVMTSPDGITWTTRTSAADNQWLSIAWSPELGLFAAVADTGTGNRVMTSPDGITWTSRTSAADNSWRSVTWSPELGLFAVVGNSGTGNRVMTSPDGITWTTRTSAADNDWLGVAWSPELGLFAAVSNSGTGDRVMTSPDGITWTTRTSAADNSWWSIAWSPELGLFAAIALTGTDNRVMTSKSGYSVTYR